MTKVVSPPTAAELLTEDPNQPTPRHRPNPPNHHQTQATLGGGIPKDKERIIVKCRAEAEDEEGAQEFNICAIIGGVVESCHLDLIFDGYAEFYVEGPFPVHLTGYFMPDMDDDEMDEAYERQMGDDEDDDSEDEDDEYDSEDDADDFGVLEDFDAEEDEEDFESGSDESESEPDEAPKKTKKGGVTIQEIDEEDEKPAKAEKKKRAAPEEPAATKEAPPAKKEKKETKAQTPAKKEKKEPAAKPETPAATSTPGKQLKREFKNGMEIVNVAMGAPDGKKAEPGKRVTMKYVGKLQSGKIFDQTKGSATFGFRLGIGEVIKGWDVGVANMRVGDKRRLTIPPAMAYGKKGVKGAIPGNATLIFDVELVNVQ